MERKCIKNKWIQNLCTRRVIYALAILYFKDLISLYLLSNKKSTYATRSLAVPLLLKDTEETLVDKHHRMTRR